LAIALREAGAGSVVGVDFSAKMLREAKRKEHLAVDGESLASSREREDLTAGVDSSRTQFADSATKVQGCTGLRPRVAWVECDAMMLPFRDEEFDAVTVGFGLRNMPSYPGALRELARVLRPGGSLVCLETTPLTVRALKLAFDWYFSRVAPLLGGWLSGDRDAYAYLPASASAFPDAEALGRMMVDAGLHRVRYLRLGAGTIALHVGIKPDTARNSAGSR
jgi:demethylmenaquinone methyltransferase/2-methoxy-6-polyprenyl-1,4-benzoquinol methylase